MTETDLIFVRIGHINKLICINAAFPCAHPYDFLFH